MRQENETVGPTVELDYWRKQQNKFANLIDEMNQRYCKLFISYLTNCKSKLEKVFNFKNLKIFTIYFVSKKFFLSTKQFCKQFFYHKQTWFVKIAFLKKLQVMGL